MGASGYRCFLLKQARSAVSVLAICVGSWGWSSALANTLEFPPQTSIRLTIVQWMSTKGEYEKWDALGGEFEVSDAGTITLPVLGAISVGDFDTAGLSSEISRRLKDKLGLVEKPEVTVAIAKYPPVYVVGDVKAPGEYPFHTGLTVLQSYAMSGGEARSQNASALDKFGFVGQLRGYDDDILRSEIRLVRLQAEMSGATEMHFDTRQGANAAAADAIYQQEKAIFLSRANLVQRQAKSYTELRDLLTAEVANLEKKGAGADEDVQSVVKEIRNIKAMVEKGIALPSRQTDLERTLRSYYAGQLDLATAIMRARQGIAEASRNLEGLYDTQHANVASELQVEQARLYQLKLKRDTTEKQMLDALSESGGIEGTGNDATFDFSVNRRVNGDIEQLAATANTSLQPGDVVRVTRKVLPLNTQPGTTSQ